MFDRMGSGLDGLNIPENIETAWGTSPGNSSGTNDPFSIAKKTAVTSSALLPEFARQRTSDIKTVKDMIAQNKAAGSRTGYLTQPQWAKTYGAKLPNTLFEQASGEKGSIWKWLTGRTSPTHFAPVETAWKGAKWLGPKLGTAGLAYGAGDLAYKGTKYGLEQTGYDQSLFDLGGTIYNWTHGG